MNYKIVIYFKITDFEKFMSEFDSIFCPALHACGKYKQDKNHRYAILRIPS